MHLYGAGACYLGIHSRTFLLITLMASGWRCPVCAAWAHRCDDPRSLEQILKKLTEPQDINVLKQILVACSACLKSQRGPNVPSISRDTIEEICTLLGCTKMLKTGGYLQRVGGDVGLLLAAAAADRYSDGLLPGRLQHARHVHAQPLVRCRPLRLR